MAKAAMRKTVARGRPKGSKNKSFLSQFKKMAFDAQADIISTLTNAYESAKQTRAADLMAQLQALGATAPKKRGRPPKSNGSGQVARKGSKAGKHPLSGRKAEAKYRSKKDSSLTWAGRGMTPKWMKAEMKGTKLKKEDFAIA